MLLLTQRKKWQVPHSNHINPLSGGRHHSQKLMGGFTFIVLLLGGQNREREGGGAGLRQPIPALYGTQFVHQYSDTGVQRGRVPWLPFVLPGKNKPICKCASASGNRLRCYCFSAEQPS